MRPTVRKAFLISVLSKFYLLQVLINSFNNFRKLKNKNRNCNFKNIKMKFAFKLVIVSASVLSFIIVVGFIIFPKMIKTKVKEMVALKEGNDIRGMFLKIPFPLNFKVYIFNVTNPMEVQRGEMPSLQEVGPFCYEEWKEKVNVQDNDVNDTIFYNPKDTFKKHMWPGCLSGEEEVTIPHPMILGMINTVSRQKPGALTLANKAIKSIYSNPTSIFITAKANEILFDGVVIHCGVKDFAGKAICSQLKVVPSLTHITEDDLAFSFLSPKNATLGQRIQAYRGIKDYRDLGRIIQFDEKSAMEVWPTDECNTISGTDGTIFPPLLKAEDGLASFAPDLCRSLVAFFVKMTKYDGIPVREYTANLGDMSQNENEKCYCLTPETCLKKGLMDLYKCAGVPIYASLPHFYESDVSYLKKVKGLKPNKTKHEIKILFEGTTGSPVYAKKRLQFSMPLQPIPKVDLFSNFTDTVLPLFWVEEGVELNNTFTKPIKDFFKIKKAVKIISWLIIVGCLGGLAAAGYLLFKENGKGEITPVHKVRPNDAVGSGVSVVNGNRLGNINHVMSLSDPDKY